jgi:hypothetical protein
MSAGQTATMVDAFTAEVIRNAGGAALVDDDPPDGGGYDLQGPGASLP